MPAAEQPDHYAIFSLVIWKQFRIVKLGVGPHPLPGLFLKFPMAISTQKLTVLVVGGVAALVAAGYFITTINRHDEPPCVTPPPVVALQDRESALKLATDLEKLKGEANVEIQFKDLMQASYAEMSDANVTLLLLFNGLHCLRKSGDLSPETEAKLVEAIYQAAMGKRGVASIASREIHRRELQAIRMGSNAELVIQRLAEHGYAVKE